MRDSHYTPNALAEYLVSCIKKENVKTVVDFCVGEGDLLKAAKKKWAKAKFYGNDISSRAIRVLKKKYPDWILEKSDFLNKRITNNISVFKKKFDIILLNPPFTCKGSTIHSVIFNNIEYHMSTAMAFLVKSISYLNAEGVLYAILPQSIAYSEKDEKIRQYLYRKYNFKIFEELNNQGFKNCSPNIVLAVINDKNIIAKNMSFHQIKNGIDRLEVQRGTLSTHKIKISKANSLHFIHTTNLKNNKIKNLKIKVSDNFSKIKGPALLINRVGQPDVRKICIVNPKEEYVLSDCIIGLKVKTMKDCQLLKKAIIDNWTSFANLYKGTGAKYVTVKRIKYFFKLRSEPEPILKIV